MKTSSRNAQLTLLRKLMEDPLGRDYMYSLLASCHIYATTFASNALTMAFREGERNIGIRLGAELTEACPELYLEMLKEQGNVRHSKPEPVAESDPFARGRSDPYGNIDSDAGQ